MEFQARELGQRTEENGRGGTGGLGTVLLPASLPPFLPSFSRQSPRDCFMAVLSIEIEGISDEGLGGFDVEG